MRSAAAHERYRTHKKVRDDSNSPSRGRYGKCCPADTRCRAVYTGDQWSMARRSRRRRCAWWSPWSRIRVCQPTRAPVAYPHTILGRAQAQRWHCTAAAALVVGRAPAEPASGYGSSAPCDRSDRRALAVDRASCRRRALMACGHAAVCCAASWVFVRCSGVDVVLSHRPQSTVPVPSAPMVGIGPLVTCRVRVGECFTTEYEKRQIPVHPGLPLVCPCGLSVCGVRQSAKATVCISK